VVPEPLPAESQDYLRDLDTVLEVARAMGAERDLERLLDLIVDAGRDLIHADRCSLFVVEESRGEIWTRVAHGTRKISLPIGSGIAGSVAADGKAVNLPDAYDDPRFNPDHDRETGYRTRSMLCMALVDHDDRVVGVIQALNKRGCGCFDAYDERLMGALCAQAGVAIQTAKLIRHDLERQHLMQEMELAREIQQSLLPRDLPDLDGWQFASWQRPCNETGGDYHDFLDGEDRLDLVVGDVSGHGLGPALLMSMARAYLRALHRQSPDLAGVLGRLNDLLVEDMGDDTFMTMAVVRLWDDGGGRYVAAGHPPPLVYRVDEDGFDGYESTGMILGAIEDCDYASVAIPPLASGDYLVLLSDGILEAVDPSTGEEFGDERVRDAVRAARRLGAEGIIRRLVQDVMAHLGEGVPEDDITMVVAERL